jgi:thiol:disulfide interchange protein DsbD
MSPFSVTGTDRRPSHSRTLTLWLLLCIAPALLPSTTLLAQGLPGAGRGLLLAPAFLPVEEAFTFYTSLPEAGVIGVHWHVVEGHYLYKDKFRFALRLGESELALSPLLPVGSSHEDEFFGAVEVYFSDINVVLPLPEGTTSGPITLIMEYQGCASAGLCYTPQRREIDLEL